ncbi:hypothetical protein OESDEN_10329 [Oesophagostomum dentatum]|uniref:UDENN domain-containing protein n=1 Tax=Oesophagostomum dentatum TaxID=61180 RepID=A0A0B1SX03_OESDE|nr:hypothetical protein OESDEN_10329 [Oesophagostomum dentatum]
MQQILHVVVVGFHHKKGCQVEFSYPKLDGDGEGGLPDEWTNLPSLALPDGAHNSISDTIFFILPSKEHPGEAVFGISCYRQIAAEVVFNISPAQLLGTTMLALVSLYPKVLEEGLRYCASPMQQTEATGSQNEHKDVSSNGNSATDNGNDDKEIVIPPSTAVLEGEPPLVKDGFGFPLSIFTKGYLFHPYLSISYLDMIRSKVVRAYAIGATNALFVTKKDLLDAIITIDEQGSGQITLLDPNLKRELNLTSADLRFCDFLLKNIEDNKKSSACEWCVSRRH